MSMEPYVTRAEACFRAVRPGFKHGRDEVYDPFEGSVLKKLRQCIEAKQSFDERNVLTQPVDRELVGRVSALEAEAEALAQEVRTRRDAVAAAAVSRLEEEFAQRDAQQQEQQGNGNLQQEQDKGQTTLNAAALADGTNADIEINAKVEADTAENEKMVRMRHLLAENAALRESLAQMLPTVGERLKDAIRTVTEGKVMQKSEVDRIMLRACSSSSTSPSSSSSTSASSSMSSSSETSEPRRHADAAVRLAKKVAAALRRPAVVAAMPSAGGRPIAQSKAASGGATKRALKTMKTKAPSEQMTVPRETRARSARVLASSAQHGSGRSAGGVEGVLQARPSRERNSRTPPPSSPTQAVWKVESSSAQPRGRAPGSSRKTPTSKSRASSAGAASARKTPQRSSAKSLKQTPGSARKVQTPCLRV